MKGKYASQTMHTVTALAPGALGLAKVPVELSKTARQRLKWFDWRRDHGATVALTCRHFGIGRQTFYRWKARYNPYNLRSLEDRSRRPKRLHAQRKPAGYAVDLPGDLVQVDTLDLRPLPGLVFKHFTARDVVSRWDVLELHGRATAGTATAFLHADQQRMPFPVRAIQVDRGSEFMAGFEQACRDRNIRLFVLPPRSPKLNGSVERAQRTHREEFYELTTAEATVAALNQALLDWERTYNHLRPHQSLGYQTPAQFLGITQPH